VEVIRLEGAPQSIEHTRPQVTIQNREEQKSLVNRLITRIRSI
jgi:hypothetical protein